MKKFIIIIVTIFVLITLVLSILVLKYRNIIYLVVKENQTVEKIYYSEDFGIEIIKSNTDYDKDGVDDYTDILLGARADAENKPTYRSAYYSGGYPPDDEGVCTDVVWRALKNAGYFLKDMVDEDIKNNLSLYPRVDGKPDPNIDFRRVPNLIVYFQKNHISLTTDLTEIYKWQPGDIVVFSTDHIGIISDKRNEKGVPYIIHNANQPNREEDGLEFYNDNWKEITYHFRLKDINN